MWVTEHFPPTAPGAAVPSTCRCRTRCWRRGAQSRSGHLAPRRAAAGTRGRHTAGPGRTACCSRTASGSARAAGLSACASSGSRRWWPAGRWVAVRGQQRQPPPACTLAPAHTDLMVWSLCRMTSWICRSAVTLVSSSSCFCVLASATHVRYVAMASSAWGGSEGAGVASARAQPSGWRQAPPGPTGRQDPQPGPEHCPPHRPSPCSWPPPPHAAACPGSWMPHPLPQAQCPPAPPQPWTPGGEPCCGPRTAESSPAWPSAGWTPPRAACVGRRQPASGLPPHPTSCTLR